MVPLLQLSGMPQKILAANRTDNMPFIENVDVATVMRRKLGMFLVTCFHEPAIWIRGCERLRLCPLTCGQEIGQAMHVTGCG